MPYLEGVVGRRFDLDRWYQRWDEQFPATRQREAVAAGRIPVIGWNAVLRSGAPVRWSEIASGSQDATIVARADDFRAYGHRVMLIFNHEPEDDLSANGSPAEFRAAFRHVVSVIRARGASNVVFVWTMMANTFNRGGSAPEAYYPGDDVVDWVAADGYNWAGSDHVRGPWREFSDIFASFNLWAERRGKPAMVAETGVLEDRAHPRRKSRWLRRAEETVKNWPRMKAVIYFQGRGWHFDSSTAAIAAYRAMGADPYFHQRRGGQSQGCAREAPVRRAERRSRRHSTVRRRGARPPHKRNAGRRARARRRCGVRRGSSRRGARRRRAATTCTRPRARRTRRVQGTRTIQPSGRRSGRRICRPGRRT